MPKKRGPDGKPIDIPSHTPPKQKPASNPLDGGDLPTDHIDGAKPRRSGLFPPPEPPTGPRQTDLHNKENREFSPPPKDTKTVIHRGRKKSSEESQPTVQINLHEAKDALQDPVAGWLVVVEGPGIGHVLTVGFGQNSIGRSKEQRICIDFGDDTISRGSHAIITYDPRGRRFYCQQGSGTNLIYLDEAPVLSPMPLENHTEISLGQTRLRFVALCGPEFSWADL